MFITQSRDSTTVAIMLILKCCVRVPDSSTMSSPSRILSRDVPLSAIVAGNKEVRLFTSKKTNRGSYHKYTPKDCAYIGRYALVNGVYTDS